MGGKNLTRKLSKVEKKGPFGFPSFPVETPRGSPTIAFAKKSPFFFFGPNGVQRPPLTWKFERKKFSGSNAKN